MMFQRGTKVYSGSKINTIEVYFKPMHSVKN